MNFSLRVGMGVFLIWTAAGQAGPVDGPKANFDRQLEGIRQKHDERIGALNGEYLKSLDALLARAKAAGNLDDAQAADEESRRFSLEPDVEEMSSASPALADVQARYRVERDRLEDDRAGQILSLSSRYDRVLEGLEKQRVADGRLDEARQVRSEREATRHSEAVQAATARAAAAARRPPPPKPAPERRASAPAARPPAPAGLRPMPELFDVQTRELQRIPPPKAPTEPQLKSYIRSILAYSPFQPGVQNTIGANEQMSMLMALEERNLDLILQEAARQESHLAQMTVARVAGSLATEASRDLILDAFKRNVHLAPAVDEKGWIDEAAPMLEYHLKNYSLMMSGFSATEVAFFRVCYKSKDPGVIKALATLMSDPKFLIFDGINANMRIPPPPEVLEARWARVGRKSGSVEMALLMLPLGNLEALETAGKYLNSIRGADDASGRGALQAVAKVTDAPVSSPREAGQWILANLNRLVWNSDTGQFVLKR
jgi:hypothetical protein